MLHAPSNGFAISRHGHLTSLLLRGVVLDAQSCYSLLEMGATSGLKRDEAANAVLQAGKSQLSVYMLLSFKTHSIKGEVGSSWFCGDESSSITRFTMSLEADPNPIKLSGKLMMI